MYLHFHVPLYNSSTVQCNNSRTTALHYDVLLYRCCCIRYVHIQKHRLTQTLSLVPRRARVRAAGERRFPLVCTHAHVPMAKSGAETVEGGAPAIPKLIGSDKKTTHNADNNIITHHQQQQSSANDKKTVYNAENNNITHHQQQHQKSSTRYIGCTAVYIHRSPAVTGPPPLVLVVHSSTRTDPPQVLCISKYMYLEYYCRYCTSLALRRSPSVARPPSLARRRSPAVARPPSLARRRCCWLYAAIPGTTYCVVTYQVLRTAAVTYQLLLL